MTLRSQLDRLRRRWSGEDFRDLDRLVQSRLERQALDRATGILRNGTATTPTQLDQVEPETIPPATPCTVCGGLEFLQAGRQRVPCPCHA